MSVPQKIFNAWKIDNKFDNGMAVICGEVYRGKNKGLWLNGLDCDNNYGIDSICGQSTIEILSNHTLVEQHDNKNKAHFYYYTDRPIKSKAPNNALDSTGKPLPQIEIKSEGNKLLYCAGGHHNDGSLIDILGNKTPQILKAEQIENTIEKIYSSTEIEYLPKSVEFEQRNSQKILEEIKNNTYQKKGEGENRQSDLLSYLTSMTTLDETLGFDEVFSEGDKFSKEHLKIPYTRSKLTQIVNSAIKYGITNRINNAKENKILESEGEEIKTDESVKEKTPTVKIYKIARDLQKEYIFMTLEGSRIKEILVYVDGIFKEYGEDIISKRSRKLSLGVKNSHINEIKGIIKDETGYHNRDIFDKKSYMLTIKNKTVNFLTGEITEHSPKYLSRVKIPIYYDENATCPRFDKFLADSLQNDEQKIQTVLEMMALCFIKDNTLVEKGFMHTGTGSNGKSVLFGILASMIGLENISSRALHDFESDSHAMSYIEGKLANICADVGSKGINETEQLKQILSGDFVNSNRKFFDSYPFQPFCTMIFSANEIPAVSDESDGFARKFELIEWNKAFYGKDRDHTIKNIRNTPSELSGIFNKLIPIAKNLLQTHALTYESTVADIKELWLKKSDSVGGFIRNECATDEKYFCPIAILWGEYNKYAKSKSMTPVSDRAFNSKLESEGLSRKGKKIDGHNTRCWFGITLAKSLRDENKGQKEVDGFE